MIGLIIVDVLIAALAKIRKEHVIIRIIPCIPLGSTIFTLYVGELKEPLSGVNKKKIPHVFYIKKQASQGIFTRRHKQQSGGNAVMTSAKFGVK